MVVRLLLDLSFWIRLKLCVSPFQQGYLKICVFSLILLNRFFAILTADSALPLLWLCVVWNCSGELEIRSALYSTLVSPTSAIECGLNFSRSGSIWLLRVFLRVLQFSSLSKIDSSQMHLSGVLCSGIMHDRLAAPIGAPFICIRPILLSCPFVIQLLGVQVRVISRHYYYYCYYYYYYYYYYYCITVSVLKFLYSRVKAANWSLEYWDRGANATGCPPWSRVAPKPKHWIVVSLATS